MSAFGGKADIRTSPSSRAQRIPAPALTLRSNNYGAATMMIDEERIFQAVVTGRISYLFSIH
jgi:hypothetical protein